MSDAVRPRAQDDESSDRDEKLAAVLSECSDRLNAGEPLDASSILANSADLLPELGWALEALTESAAAPEGPLRLETVGHHRILCEIGRGGMGIVYDAVELTLGRRVALKVLPLPAFVQGGRRERFLREARAAARLHHTRIVPVFEVGEERGVLYYTMQHISGRSLDRLVRLFRRGPRPAGAGAPSESEPDAIGEALAARVTGSAGWPTGSSTYCSWVARLGADLAGALAHAHREGVIHRDVKPSNVIIDGEGSPWLTDFGLAKSDLDSEALTESGDVLGTVAYMAPERLGGEGDARSDVYSLGATLYELLALEPPFQDPDRRQLLRAVAEREAARLRRLQPQVPRDLETIVHKAMAREPSHRYGSAAELQADLERFLRGESIAARRSSALEQAARWCRRHPLVASLSGAVALLLIVLVAVLMVSARSLRRRLYESELANARTLLVSGRPGRRFESLAAVSRAAQLAEEGTAREALRDVAIQALSLMDLREVRRRPEPLARENTACDSELMRYAALDRARGEIVLRNVADGADLQRFGAGGVQHLLAMSPDGQFLAAGRHEHNQHSVRIWRLADASVRVDFAGGSVHHPLAFHPLGRSLAIARPEAVILFDLEAKVETRRWKTAAPTNGLKFSPSGDRIAAAIGESGVVEIWNVGEDPEKVVIDGDPVHDLAWDPGGRLLAVATSTEHLRVYNAETGELFKSLEGHLGSIIRVLFHPEGGTLFSASWDGTLRAWDPWSGDPLLTMPLNGRLEELSRDGSKLLVAGEDLAVMAVEPGKERRIYKALSAPAVTGGSSVQFHARGRLLLTYWGLWDTVLAKDVVRGAGWPGPVPTTFSPDGKSLVVSPGSGVFDHPFELLSAADEDLLRAGKEGQRLDLPAGSNVFAFDPSGRRLVAVEPDGKVVLLERQGDRKKTTLGVHQGVDRLSVSPEGRWAATGTFLHGLGVRIWDLDGGRLERELEEAQPARGYFSPCGRWLATAVAREYKIHATGAWSVVRTLTRETVGGVQGPVAWHPDGKRIALAITPSEIQMLDAESGRAVGRFGSDRPRMIQDIAFSPDGELLALARADTATEVWDLRAIEEGLATLGLSPEGEGRVLERPAVLATRPLRVEWVDPVTAGEGDPEAIGEVESVPRQTIEDLSRLGPIIGRLERVGDYARALRLWERAREASPRSALAANNLAWALVTYPAELRDPPRAVALAEEAVRAEGGISTYVNTLGVARYRAGSFRQAVDTLLESARRAGSVTAWDGLFIAMALKRMGLDSLAADYYENGQRWITHHPDLPPYEKRQLQTFLAEATEVIEGRGSPSTEGPRE